jgi:D-alanyl-lipoteichoic acid acyltransferase DltB (MBOAT superfamily)
MSSIVLTPAGVVALPAALDARAARAQPAIRRFIPLFGQLALLLAVFRLFNLEDPAFLLMAGMAVGGFAVHYWLPFAYKEVFWIALSIGGAFVLVDTLSAILLLAIGLLFFAILSSPLSFATRLALLVGVAGVLTYGRATLGLGIPTGFWPVFGAIFMFRLMIYVYDLRHQAAPPRLKDFLAYFYILPNYCFLLFPVIDFQTMRKCYYQRDIHAIAQQGIAWMVRGTIHLLLYRLIYQLKGPAYSPQTIMSLADLWSAMVLTYLLYLRVSGQFHIIIGLLHLFGYDLPETHRNYLLARSLTDFWRRINIYWKDFMVKLVYFPMYFRLRRSGEVRAQVIATAAVFTATWLLHSYQWFWLRGEVLFTWPDFLFWAVLGALVTVNLLIERGRKRKPQDAGVRGWTRHALHVCSTFALMTVLWSMWNAPSMRVWFDVISWWRVG